jgi:DNA repair exonuclease SbcCD nuclease subunit
MRFIHTADWQIGKPFRQFGDNESVLQRARLDAIEAIGALARREGAAHVLVAGDIYDMEVPKPLTLRQPLERMKLIRDVVWHLLPGNHDPHRPRGLWDRLREPGFGLPDNVRLNLAPEPVPLGDEAMLLPAPLTRKSESADLTEWFDAAATPEGRLRIGLAHGAVKDFGLGGEAGNPIDPTRPARARLDYLALGDWHAATEIGPRLWYSGTPEPDRAGGTEIGEALVVEIEGAGAVPRVTRHIVGRYRWLTREAHLADASDLADFETGLRALPALTDTVLRLRLKGALPLVARGALDRRLEALRAAVFDLAVDTQALAARPTAADLEAIDFGGVLRDTAERLQRLAADGALAADKRRAAEEALVELFILAGEGKDPSA